MAHSFRSDLDLGYRRPVRYRRGEGVNVWADAAIELARRLDGMEMSAEVAEAVSELFQEVGQIARDAEAL